jgi:hypothetical protein
MTPDRPGAGRRAGDEHAEPRLGLCQILAQRQERAQLRTRSSEDPDTQPRAAILRFPLTRLTRK